MSEKKEKTKICRISKLKGFEDILAGRDFSGIFKEGHVYSVTDVMGVIMFEDIGEYDSKKTYGWRFSDIMMDGSHLIVKSKAFKT